MISVVLALGHAAAWAAMSSSTTWEPLPPRAASEPPRQVLLHNFYDTQIPYADAWDCQRHSSYCSVRCYYDRKNYSC